MSNAIMIAGLIAAGAASISVAVLLEWLALRALLLLMPAGAARSTSMPRRSHANSGLLRVSSPELHV